MHIDVKEPGPGNLAHVDAEDYLLGLQALALELDVAMAALVSNTLRSFEESLVRQRTLCERLAKLSRSLASANGVDVVREPMVEAGLAERITDASVKLFRLNKQYSRLTEALRRYAPHLCRFVPDL